MARNKTTLLVRIELLLFAVIVFFFFFDLSSRKPFADLHVQVERNNSLLNQKEVLLQSDFDVTSNNSLVLSDPLSTPHMSDFRWSGGGISGPTEGIENINLDTEIHKAVLQEFEAAIGVRAAAFKAFNTSTEHSQPNISAFVTFFTSKVANNTNPDCADRLHASHQLLCHVWAAQWQHNQSSDNSHQNNNNHSSVSSDDKDSSSSLFKDTALHSMCSLFLACAEWRCGRYSVPLSNALLQSTFESIVEDTALSNGSGVLLRNLIHGGSNWREYDWLADRVQTSRELLEGHTSPFDVRTVF
ncbi:membrane-associated protein, putative [Bodo saltans]|uniref:Membrane-associated protein, putative n=1 Tax=Bodo saltans TaxID=75058 RepID=A0A0S4J1C4_BODSA|nr:membrane-associated protein, putative [Bodo saltans]|eukprot:CUG46909.1 membrane-associated protein, putative [Bodo saltans]